MVNKFILNGTGTEIDYTNGANPSFPALSISEAGNTKTFTPAQITTDQTALGALVSVPLVETIDGGRRRFGFFPPDVEVALGQSVTVTTIAARKTLATPNGLPHLPTTWQCVHLQGKAEEVIVPLEHTAPA